MRTHRTALFSILFWILAVAFIVLTGYYIVTENNVITDSADENTDLYIKWYSSNNIEIDPSNHSHYSVIMEDNVFSIYHTTEYALSDARLAFETAFADAEVFLNDNLVYSTKNNSGTETSKIFNLDAPAPQLHFVDFDTISSGDVIRVNVQLYYDDGSDGISGLMFGKSEDISGVLEKKEYLGLFLCIVLFSFGIVMLVLRFSARRNILTYGLEYIAFFAFFSTIFSFLHSSVFFMEVGFTGDVVYILYCMSFVLMFLPLILFFADNMAQNSSQTFLYADFIFQVLFFAAMLALSIFGIANLHTTHFYAEIIGIVQCLLILIMLIIDFAKKIERRNSDLTLLAIYAVFLAVAVTGQFIDFGSPIPILWTAACLFLMAAIAVTKVKAAAESLMSVTETEKIGKLAFEDGLTGVGNTAAFRKKLSHLEVVKINYKTIGIVQFDINNLKTINDNLGHEMGDKLITDGSAMISRIFGKIGDVYRTGGDEFVAIVCGDKAASLCNDAFIEFENAMEEYNSDTTHKFRLQVAYGVEFYRSDTDKRYVSLRQIQKKADEKMYNKKREMKATMQSAIVGDDSIPIDRSIR